MVEPEYEDFDALLKRLLKVSHVEIKTKLEEEKAAKKRKKAKKSSASREGA